ncbi:MAG: histidine kinase [Candidatus Pedobacter colombiensis]|uniref:Histidine kinase n=1 Tax=Candidatus Pedobacter colombiensis TaxID=3121371 RepID=A0AAJ5WA72_9SPHI|nr:histidine kinase [Pedobacter sp.]WEK20887.1 MAG: histidine kinase [Pedobacter sp.]
MNRNFYLANNRILTHILFWIAYILIYTGVHAEGEKGLFYYLLIELQGLPAAMLVAYINLYILFPRYFKTKKYGTYALTATLLLFTASLLHRILIEKYIEPTFYPTTTFREPIFVWYMLLKGMLWILSPVLMFTLVVKIYQQWFQQEQQHQEILKEKLSAELSFLKAQVHPHFLFNTLNNLYALTLESSPAAPKVVLKLSELMSYMLYDSQSSYTSLEKEFKHIQNYIELEQLRYGNRLEVSLNISGDVSAIRLPPFLLIPFIENAFKHGVSDQTDQVWVTVDLKYKSGLLTLKVENSCTNQPEQRETINEADYKKGIGLQNVKRRLELIYPGQHELLIHKETERFTVDLRINNPEHKANE